MREMRALIIENEEKNKKRANKTDKRLESVANMCDARPSKGFEKIDWPREGPPMMIIMMVMRRRRLLRKRLRKKGYWRMKLRRLKRVRFWLK